MTEGEIERIFMNPLQERVFQMFVALGDERSIPKLHAACKHEGIEQAEITLKRWSQKFKWQDLAQHTDHQIAKAIAEHMLPDHIERTRKGLEYIEKMKEAFYAKVDAGKVDLSVMEFIALLKADQLLLGNPTDRNEHQHTVKVELNLSDDEMREAVRFAAARKRGLPIPSERDLKTEYDVPMEERQIINVTPSDKVAL